MTDVESAAGPATTRSDEADEEVGGRGKLTIREKVAQRLAVRSALDTRDVMPFAAGLTNIAGRAPAKADVTLTGNGVSVHVKVAVAWPAPAAEVARAVQRNVAEALSTLAGFDVRRVDVTVEQFSTGTDENVKRVR